MTTADAFRRAIWQERDNDALRIALADWLEDHGGEEYGEFIRVQCELATRQVCRCVVKPDRRVWCRRCKGKPATRSLRRRERELLEAHGEGWAAGLIAAIPGSDSYGPTHGETWAGAMSTHFEWEYRRGFVADVTLSWQDWTRYHLAVLDAAPLERVVLTTEPAIGTLLSTKWPRITFDLSQLRQPG
jgi:uncharacterized protein (TIGR02996 family)